MLQLYSLGVPTILRLNHLGFSTKADIHKTTTNLDPKLHPFEAPREYKRALNAGMTLHTLSPPVSHPVAHTSLRSVLPRLLRRMEATLWLYGSNLIQ